MSLDYNKKNIILAKICVLAPLHKKNVFGMIFYQNIQFVFNAKRLLTILLPIFTATRQV